LRKANDSSKSIIFPFIVYREPFHVKNTKSENYRPYQQLIV